MPRPMPIARRAFFFAGVCLLVFFAAAMIWAALAPDGSTSRSDEPRVHDSEER